MSTLTWKDAEQLRDYLPLEFLFDESKGAVSSFIKRSCYVIIVACADFHFSCRQCANYDAVWFGEILTAQLRN